MKILEKALMFQVALYIFTNQSDSNMTAVKYNENRSVLWRLTAEINGDILCRRGIQERFRQTDRALEEVPTWPDVGQLAMFFFILFSM